MTRGNHPQKLGLYLHGAEASRFLKNQSKKKRKKKKKKRKEHTLHTVEDKKSFEFRFVERPSHD